MKALNIIETGYRATLEEQDDPGVWLSYTLKSAGGDVDVLLRGNAVNYAVEGQDATGLQYGTWQQTQPPRLADNIASMTPRGWLSSSCRRICTSVGWKGFRWLRA